jgi:hypothetical protein
MVVGMTTIDKPSRDETPLPPFRVEEEPADYEWRCFDTLTCEPFLDQHGRECDRLNDEARADHYADLVADDIAYLVRWHVREAFAS